VHDVRTAASVEDLLIERDDHPWADDGTSTHETELRA
jgi:hypothetical protein